MRAKTTKFLKKHDSITWRSHEPSRLETFSDAIFAFGITLVIISLDVPKSFSELFEVMKGTLGFAACFAILFHIWSKQNIFFRRYGLSDTITTVLNGILLFVILTYVYPLKFLFNILFSGNEYKLNQRSHEMIQDAQVPALMVIYGIGFATINGLFFLMYRNVSNHVQALKLTAAEVYKTNTHSYGNLIAAIVSLVSITVAVLVAPRYSGFSGFVYMLIPAGYSACYAYRDKKARKIFELNEDPDY